MNPSTLCSLLAILVSGSDPSGSVAPSVDQQASCSTCHRDVVDARNRTKDVHDDLGCSDCHPGRGFNPHVPPDLTEEQQEAAKSFGHFAKHSPAAFLACGDCHDEVVSAWKSSVHAKLSGSDDRANRPACTSCHGSAHEIQKQNKLGMSERCIACHAFAEEGKQPTSPFVVDTYRDTIHGKMLHLGNERAAGCADCHTGHNVLAAANPESSVGEKHRAETCGKCHEGATPSFAAAISHEPHRIDVDFWAWLFAIGFSILTVSTIFLLFVHITLDFVRAGRNAWARTKDPAAHHGEGPIPADAEVHRFDIHARAQHWGMMASFITLVVTGWPLKAAHVGVSSTLAQMVGGQATLAIIHRIAGAVMLAVSVYHLAYLLIRIKRGTLQWAMLPSPKDIRDVFENLMYLLGLRSERPRFGKWTYYEKFDYWAVFWGMAIMGGSGLILWFPVIAAKILPGHGLVLAQIAHSDEALLAALAIFVWHFYNVHLKPSIFPMSWVWLNGKLTAEALYEEHRMEYEARYGTKPPAAPESAPTWHTQARWSFFALGIVVLAAAAVIIGNVASVRDRVNELTGHTAMAATHQEQPNEATPVSAYGEGFNAFERCFGCHSKERFERGKPSFPHKMHFEEQDVKSECTSCHETAWHSKMSTKTEVCVDCHEAQEIGLIVPEPAETP